MKIREKAGFWNYLGMINHIICTLNQIIMNKRIYCQGPPAFKAFTHFVGESKYYVFGRYLHQGAQKHMCIVGICLWSTWND